MRLGEFEKQQHIYIWSRKCALNMDANVNGECESKRRHTCIHIHLYMYICICMLANMLSWRENGKRENAAIHQLKCTDRNRN